MKGSMFPSYPSPSHHDHHRSNSPPQDLTYENVESAECMIRKWDFDTHFSSIFADDRKKARAFLDAVATLQSAMHYYLLLDPNSDKLITAKNLMPVAMRRLEREFYVILSSNRKHLDSESVSSRSSQSQRSIVSNVYEDENTEEETNSPPMTPRGGTPRASDKAIEDLKSIADCMIASGYGKECVAIYRVIRRSIIDESLYYLGVKKLSHSKMQKMEWKVLEPEIKTWLRAVRVAVKTLFRGERILCDAVFSFSEKTAESCFSEISRDAAVNLFRFAVNFGKSKRILSPEKIFRALDIYEGISELWPEIESVFSHESLSAVRSEAMAALVKLGEAVRVMLAQFEAAIQKDASKSTADGGIHPLTRYVMNFLVFVADYSGAVSDIVTDWPMNSGTPLPESYFSSPTAGGGDEPAAAITGRVAWLILVLLCKLDGKAVQCNDVALSYLFLANNLNYVVSKVRNSNLGFLIGLDWIWKHRSKVNQYVANYERLGWSKVISALPEDPTVEISLEEAKGCFRRFNSGFQETCKKQAPWVIPDPKLRDEVKISVAEKLVPRYRALYQKHRGEFTREVGVDVNVKYAPEDLSNYLSDLFLAVVRTAGSTRSSHGMSSLRGG